MEGERSLEINVISARDIKNVKVFSKMNVYVVVSLTGGPTKKKLQKVKTPVDREGGVNPTWNFPVKLRVAESLAQQNALYVVFKLKSEAALGDKDLGEVNVPVKEMLDEYYKIKGGADHNKPPLSFLSYQVRTPSGKPQGELNFSYKFTDEILSATSSIPKSTLQQQQQPVTAYPAVPPAGPSSSASAPPYSYPYAYPPPPPATGYPYYAPPPPPPPYYSQAGYGYYYPQQPQQKKNNKLGLGLGAGLLGGVLGGLLIGDLVSDVASYDAGYDGGFGDGGGGFGDFGGF